MPEITLIGWFHTVIGIASILLGFYSFFSFKLLSWNKIPSRIYLVLTFITAVTALAIYNQGGFGIAHIMGVLACLLYTSPSPRDMRRSRMPSSA